MEWEHRRTLEVVAFLCAYAVVYLTVLGPLLGGLLPGFDRPMLSGPEVHPGGDLPDTGRGWLFVLLGVPVLLAYMLLRARLSGHAMAEFWDPPSEGE